MEEHRVAVISDTHGLLRPECVSVLKTCEAILHAGDVGELEICRKLEEIAPTYGVRGNVDRDLAELPAEREIALYGFRFYVVHNKKDIREELSKVDVVVYGHSHKYEERREGGRLYLNPGSCGRRRFRLPVTMAVLTLYPQEHCCVAERVELQAGQGAEEKEEGFSEVSYREMDRLIREVVKEMKAGRSVDDIAARRHADRELVEQICRIYATHPGVDVDGILNRMEIKDM
ncbi:MAG: metallophosphatase family protein [Candidatus Gastranaerophilales bacterium]|nr:metallophosphatase family protein [Candidatus Gastranaerophilales bacterium]